VQHAGTIVQELVDLLRIPNVASDTLDLRRNADRLLELLRHRGIAARILDAPGSPPAVLGQLTTPGAHHTIVLYAHFDGQPVDATQWATPPWTPALRDRPLEDGGTVIPIPAAPAASFGDEWRLYARSASDDKAPVIAMLTALDALRANSIRPSVNLKFFFEGGEEAGSPNLRTLLARHADALGADAWFFCDGPVHQTRRMQVVFGVRGTTDLELTVYGPNRALHSGHYGNWAPNPGAGLATLLASMRDPNAHILIPGWYDDVRPITRAEHQAVAEMPPVDDELRRSLALGWTEGDGTPLTERLMLPALNIRGIIVGHVGPAATNAISPVARASIDFRLVPDENPARVRELVESHARAQGYYIVHAEPSDTVRRTHPHVLRLDWGEGYPATRTDMELPVARAVVRVVAQATGTPAVRVPTLGGSLPMALFAEVLHVPLIIVPIVNHDNNQHAANENLRIRNLWDGIDVLGVLIARLGEEWR
jgi:acetylornithine deacetylase/succinyl-diaminopimelate desuccinylase-like protein